MTQRGGTGTVRPAPTPPRPPGAAGSPPAVTAPARFCLAGADPVRFSSAWHGTAQHLAARLGSERYPGTSGPSPFPSETLRDRCGGCGAAALGHGTCPVRLGPAQPAGTGLRAPGCVRPAPAPVPRGAGGPGLGTAGRAESRRPSAASWRASSGGAGEPEPGGCTPDCQRD